MSSFEVMPSLLAAGASSVRPAAGALSGTQIAEPDPAMYGPFVGSAAADCEPSTTQSFNELLKALGGLVGDVADRLDTSSRCYLDAEKGNTALASRIGGLL